MQHCKLRAHRCSRIINKTSQLGYEYIFNIGTAGLGMEDSTPGPETTRSQSTRIRARGDLLHDSTETQTKNIKEDIDAAVGSPSHDLPEWL